MRSWESSAILMAAVFAAGSARAGCAGLTTGSISSKFSEARVSCAPVDDPAATPAPTAIVIVPQPFQNHRSEARASVAVPYSALRSPRRAGAGVGGPLPRGGSTLLAVSRRYRIDPLLLHSIVARESAGRIGAVSNKGALGLMQIMPGTARSLGIQDPSRLLVDPQLNLVAGATYLKQLQGQFGNNVPAVLAAYNAGPGAVRRYRGTPPYAETQHYVRTIMSRYRGARGERTTP